MTQNKNEQITKVMLNSLLELKNIVMSDLSNQHDYLSVVNVFLMGMISTTVDFVELHYPGSAPLLYSDIEAIAKAGGLRVIEKTISNQGHTQYSVSNIDPDDMTTAMNYLGQLLSTTLFKGTHELPMKLRKPETWLRAIEVLLANLLSQKFSNPHDILNSLCEHVHMALSDLESRKH